MIENKKIKYQFNDLMGAAVETGDKFLDKKLNQNIAYLGGGGSGGGGNQQQDVAPTLRPYVTDILNRAKGLYGADQPYIPYEGERIVGFSDPELTAQQRTLDFISGGGLSSVAPGLASPANYYAPAYGLLGSAGEAFGAQAGMLGGMQPALGMYGAALGEQGNLLGMQAPMYELAGKTYDQYGRLLGTQEQTLGAAGDIYGTQLGLLGGRTGYLDEATQRYLMQEAALGAAYDPLSAARERVGIQEDILAQTSPYYSQLEQILGRSGEAALGLTEQSKLAQEAAARAIGRDEMGAYALGSEDIQKYIDPYQQAVIDLEKQKAVEDAQLIAGAIGEQAAQAGAGAFGGSRQAILESQAASDLGKRLSEIQTRGSQAAYDRALATAVGQQQIGLSEAAAQRAREAGYGQGLQGLAGMTSSIYGQQTGGYGELINQLRGLSSSYGGTGQQLSGLAGQMADMSSLYGGIGGQYLGVGSQLGDIASGYGGVGRDVQGLASSYGQAGQGFGQLGGMYAGLGDLYGGAAGRYGDLGTGYGNLSNLYAAGAGAYGGLGGNLGALSGQYQGMGDAAYNQTLKELANYAAIGEMQRGMGQQRADLAYEEFLRQKGYPTEQLQLYSSLVQGFPAQTFQYQQPLQGPSGLQQTVGTLGQMAMMGKAFGLFAAGGQVKRANGGGGLSGLTVKRQAAGQPQLNLWQDVYLRVGELRKQIETEADPAKKALLQAELDKVEQLRNEDVSRQIGAADALLPTVDSDVASATRGQLKNLLDLIMNRQGKTLEEREGDIKDMMYLKAAEAFGNFASQPRQPGVGTMGSIGQAVSGVIPDIIQLRQEQQGLSDKELTRQIARAGALESIAKAESDLPPASGQRSLEGIKSKTEQSTYEKIFQNKYGRAPNSQEIKAMAPIIDKVRSVVSEMARGSPQLSTEPASYQSMEEYLFNNALTDSKLFKVGARDDKGNIIPTNQETGERLTAIDALQIDNYRAIHKDKLKDKSDKEVADILVGTGKYYLPDDFTFDDDGDSDNGGSWWNPFD